MVQDDPMTESMGLLALQDLPVFQAIAESGWMFPALESLHVVAIALVVGSILFVDLRLLGVIWRRDPVVDVTAGLLPVTWAGFGIAVLSGFLMFGSSAVRYSGNPAFLAKLALLALAGINMAVFHRFSFPTVKEWGSVLPTPRGVRLAAALSIGLWAGILVLGRWVGFI
jgi:hypothetical protein